MKKDFKNIVTINLGHLYEAALEEDLGIVNNEFTKNKWFSYVVADDVIDELRNILKNPSIDRGKLQKIIYDDVINTRNVVYSSVNQDDVVNKASHLAENTLVLQLT